MAWDYLVLLSPCCVTEFLCHHLVGRALGITEKKRIETKSSSTWIDPSEIYSNQDLCLKCLQYCYISYVRCSNPPCLAKKEQTCQKHVCAASESLNSICLIVLKALKVFLSATAVHLAFRFSCLLFSRVLFSSLSPLLFLSFSHFP